MKMQFAPIFLVNALLCIQFVCLCNGAPPKRDGQPSSSSIRDLKRYTDQEREFIKNELISLPSDFFEASDTTVWQYLSNKIQEKRRLGAEGFPKDRGARVLRQYFKSTLMKNAEFMAALPENLRQQFCNLQRSQHYAENGKLAYDLDRYTYEEDKLIVDIISSPQYTDVPIYAFQVWKEVARQFHIKRNEGSPGFHADRTPFGLRQHFMKTMLNDPNGRVRVPVTLIRKYLTPFNKRRQGDEGTSSQPASQSQQTNLQALNETQGGNQDEWASLIRELQDAPFGLDFSRMGESTSSSFPVPDDLEIEFEDFYDTDD